MRIVLLLIIGLFILAGCEGDQGPQGPAGGDGSDGSDWPGPPPDEYVNADGIAGGAAYAKWWTAGAGGSGQPNTNVGADFYRCKACHAWDGMGNAASYADRTGQSTDTDTRPDVSSVNLRSTAESESFEELFNLVRHVGARGIDASDNTHPDFSQELTDAQVWNIVKFMREEWVDPNLLYDIEVSGPAMHWDYTQATPVLVKPAVNYSNVGALGDEANGQAIYTAKCADCHGDQGLTHDIGGRSLGQFIREKPNEGWFKAKFGEDGTGMDPGLVTSTSDLQDLYKALANSANFPDLP
ncbi:MAG: cytochrome c [Candidatus Krumholzibacteria bacterium]|nr:cytochrome c [Candidatus Krumholzibacteria bacterium]